MQHLLSETIDKLHACNFVHPELDGNQADRHLRRSSRVLATCFSSVPLRKGTRWAKACMLMPSRTCCDECGRRVPRLRVDSPSMTIAPRDLPADGTEARGACFDADGPWCVCTVYSGAAASCRCISVADVLDMEQVSSNGTSISTCPLVGKA